MSMAKQLIKSMSAPWRPQEYQDDYREALEKLIEEKIEHGGTAASKPRKSRRPANVIDLAAVLQQSLKETGKRPRASKRRKRAA